MNFGDIQQIGTPHEVYHYPTNLFVARFIGSPGMNFISGKIITELGKVLVELPGQLKAGLNEKQQDALSKSNQSRDVVLGVRPEDVRVFPQEETLYPAEVYVFEPLGVQNIVTLKIADTLIKATLSGDVFLQIGEKVSVSFREIRIFDKQSEKLIA
jgi:multiple sugar transport system ATP-binding protein